MSKIKNSPPWGITLQVLALSLQHAGSDFCSCGMILSRILNVLYMSNWDPWIHHIVAVFDKCIPFMIFR
jgi:hypothetical protein